MADLPDPAPSSPTKPPLTADMLAEAKAAGTPRPGAGGWIPSPLEQLLATIGCGLLASASPLLLQTVPAPWNMWAAGASALVAASVGAFFGIKSAGPRVQS